MSVNLSLASTNKKLGKYANTIDFQIENASKSYLQSKGDDSIVGKFMIDNRYENVTLRVLNEICNTGNLSYLSLPSDVNSFERSYIVDTFLSAKNIFWKKVKLKN